MEAGRVILSEHSDVSDDELVQHMETDDDIGSSPQEEGHLEQTTINNDDRTYSDVKMLKPRSPKQSGVTQRITVYITPSDNDLPSLQTSNDDTFRLPPLSSLQNVPKYHFTRYFLRQLLVICQIKPIDADNVVTRVKEYLIDAGFYHITQWQLEKILFDILARSQTPRSNITVSQFRVVNRFHASRGALIIVVTGAPCFGRPVVPLKLAERLNVPNVVRTQVVANVLSYPVRSPSIPEGTTDEAMLSNFKSMCRAVQKGLTGDLEKARCSGKSVLFEGLHIDPELYLDLFVPSESQTPYAKQNQMSNPPLVEATTSAKTYPVVVVPFLLVGHVEHRQVRQSQGELGHNIDRPLKALQVIDRYMRQFESYMNVIQIESQEVSEQKLDTMHQIVLRYIQKSSDAGIF